MNQWLDLSDKGTFFKRSYHKNASTITYILCWNEWKKWKILAKIDVIKKKKEPTGIIEFKNTVTEFLNISLDLLSSKVEMTEDKISEHEDG